MKIRVLGGGWYGASASAHLLAKGHNVTLFEKADHLFAGASGANPARLHKGFHYPRSMATRAFCQAHAARFEEVYGHLTRAIPINIYAIAAHDSLMDFGTYVKVLSGEVDFMTILRPAEFGLQNVEGAVQTNERHIVADHAREHFEKVLDGHVVLNADQNEPDEAFDLTIDCTFCANDAENIDRFEPCVTALVKGPTDKAVTIMDGALPSLYPWNEAKGLSSLTSARYTPLTKDCKTYAEAAACIREWKESDFKVRCAQMMKQIAHFWPEAYDLYEIVEYRTAIRAMPRSGADARLVDIVKTGDRRLRVRAGKIDAVLHACDLIDGHIRRSGHPDIVFLSGAGRSHETIFHHPV